MTVAVPSREEGAVVPSPVTAAEAAALGADDVLARLGSGTKGLAEGEAARRLAVVGPNAVRSHRVHALSVRAWRHRADRRLGAQEPILSPITSAIRANRSRCARGNSSTAPRLRTCPPECWPA